MIRTPLSAPLAAAVALTTALVLGAAPPATGAGTPDIRTRVATWDDAASTLGTAGSLWEPTWTADLEPSGRIAVQADGLTFADAAVTGGDTYAGGAYGARRTVLRLEERWAGTGWAVEPDLGPRSAKVERVTMRMGTPGMRYTVRGTVYANCLPKGGASSGRSRCSRSDVLEHGGALVFTMRPASTMTAPGTTAVVITATGLRFRQLLRVARSLEQVAGTPTVPGSAQMVGMCQQMVDGRMTAEQATEFARQNGYSARLGSIDGQPLAVTLDYRPDRFTLAIVDNAVAACQYG